MEFKKFEEIEKYIVDNKIVKTIALASAQDENALSAVVNAKSKGLVKAILIGDIDKIKNLLIDMNENVDDYEYISCNEENECARIAVSLVNEGKADIPMKGLMMTSSFMRAILNKETGLLPDGNILSQASVYQFDEEDRFMIISDCAVNITPNLEDKIKITKNAIELALILGIDKPNVAILSALEKVNPKIQSTVDADYITNNVKFENAGSVYGPLAMDITISKEAALHKGTTSDVCGNADILIMPNLDSGNIFTKGLVFLGNKKIAGTLVGSKSPVIMTSRTDTKEDKFLSILIALLQCK